ncbi:mannitol dehydrogenase family protein [Enterococcus termitis]|uniref:Fructuronate reductase n=1 Tax=Enterococcus termitis TaxID=332950 RepID=A0A1E5GC13_9ENTE|nr:mannitol dehydrogenase family protein [Enterococcus termitis]OEG09780.1 hypothetical protein BCR25_09735 [Enterococcus termitis]OJG96909.1 dioxygenase [Enterococcus termitis]
MKITESYIVNKDKFKDVNIQMPLFDDVLMKQRTKEQPKWLHFGGGNLYRCFHAKVAQDLLNQNLLETGIVVVENFGEALIKEVYQKNNNRSLTVTMKVDGSFEKELIASTSDAYFVNKNEEAVATVSNYFKQKSLQLVTLTITEKGYGVKDSAGQLLKTVESDINVGPKYDELTNTMSQLAYFLLKRYEAGKLPLALVSTDNFSHNGDRLKEALKTVVMGWVSLGHVSKDFATYLFESNNVSFPYSMIDRITPGPSEKIAVALEAQGIENMVLIPTSFGASLANFVNTEETCYLAIEDHFPNGRPAFEKVNNVYLADRETINKVDLMKVTTCLNPLHTSLAITGCLFGYESIYETVQDKDLLALIEYIGYKEGLPVVQDPKIIDPKRFIDEAIYKRFMNPNIPDTPQRIATDTSQKLAVRFGETIASYVNSSNLEVKELTFIPFVIAAWCRYLMGIDDAGNSFEPSPDPLYEELFSCVQHLRLGSDNDVHKALAPILSNRELFGMDLYLIGLGAKIEKIMEQLVSKPFAVRETLQIMIREEKF